MTAARMQDSRVVTVGLGAKGEVAVALAHQDAAPPRRADAGLRVRRRHPRARRRGVRLPRAGGRRAGSTLRPPPRHDGQGHRLVRRAARRKAPERGAGGRCRRSGPPRDRRLHLRRRLQAAWRPAHLRRAGDARVADVARALPDQVVRRPGSRLEPGRLRRGGDGRRGGQRGGVQPTSANSSSPRS